MAADRRFQAQLQSISRAAWKGRWALAIGLVATMAPAITLTLLHDHPYRAEAQMVIRQLPSDVAQDATPVDARRRLLNEIAVLEGDEVAARVRSTLGIAGVVPSVDGFTNGTADVVVARVDSKIAGLAAELANAYVDSYIAVQVERLSGGLRNSIANLESEIDSLQDQINVLPGDDPKITDLQAQQTRDSATLESMNLDLAVAEQPAEVVVPAAVPSDPLQPSLLRPVLLSILIGLILGGIGVALMNRGRKEVRTAEDLGALRSTEPVMAVLPSDGTNTTPIVIRQPIGRFADNYVPLRAALLKLNKERNVQVVQFCSPNDGDGTTTTAVNAAIMLARSNLVRVALVDMNMRAPRVHTMLGLEPAPGVTDALDEEADTHQTNALDRLERMGRVGIGVGDELAALDSLGGLAFVGLDDADARPLSIPTSIVDKDLAVITSGTRPRSALEVLSRRRMDDLMDDLRSTYDIIILDSPAVLASGDAVTIGRHADGVVLVVKSGTVTMPEVRQSLGTVERSGARILGVVLTGSSI